jgi:hypothetical protein
VPFNSTLGCGDRESVNCFDGDAVVVTIMADGFGDASALGAKLG